MSDPIQIASERTAVSSKAALLVHTLRAAAVDNASDLGDTTMETVDQVETNLLRFIAKLERPASVVSSEEGGRGNSRNTPPNCTCDPPRRIAVGVDHQVQCEWSTGEAVRAVEAAASVVGDASEGEAVPFDRHAILAACASASFPDDLANQILSLLGCYDARTASLRSTRAALEEARTQRDKLESAVRWALGENGEFASPSETLTTGRYYWRRELRERAFGAIPSQESTKV